MCVCVVWESVSGGAFCAVTTLPPPEQAAAESSEEQASWPLGYSAAALVGKNNSQQRLNVAVQLFFALSARLRPETEALLCYSEANNPLMMSRRRLSTEIGRAHV